MSNKYLPASQYLETITAAVEIPVLTQVSTEVTLPIGTAYTLYLGTLIDFGVTTGVVTAIGTVATVLLLDDVPVTSGLIKDILTYPSIPTQVGIVSGGSLLVYCEYPSTHIAGYIGWSLFDAANNLLAIGNDYEQIGACRLAGSSVWQPGVYRLEVVRFDSSNSPIDAGTRYFSVPTAKTQITAGALNDIEPILILKG